MRIALPYPDPERDHDDKRLAVRERSGRVPKKVRVHTAHDVDLVEASELPRPFLSALEFTSALICSLLVIVLYSTISPPQSFFTTSSTRFQSRKYA